MENQELILGLAWRLAIVFVVVYILAINTTTYIFSGGRKNMRRDYHLLKHQYVVVVNRVITSSDMSMSYDMDSGIIRVGTHRFMYLTLSSFLSPFYIYWYFKFKKMFIKRAMVTGYHKTQLV